MAQVIFDEFVGQVIEVDGVCYYFDHLTPDTPTKVPGDVSGVYADCNTCGSSSSSAGSTSNSSTSQSFSASSCSSSSSPNACAPEPSMRLTVVSEYGVGTVNWCGQSWTLPGDSGITKTACATNYVKSKSTTSGGTPGFSWVAVDAHELWQNNSNLLLERRYQARKNYIYFYPPGFTFTTATYWVNRARLSNNVLAAKRDSVRFQNPPPPPGGTYTVYSDLGLGLEAVPATPSDYDLAQEFFGTFVQSGVTYIWSMGGGW